MSQVLKLEYACTAAERSEAEELDLRRQLGRGSKWRTNAIVSCMVMLMFAALYLQIRREVSAPYQLYAFGAVIALIVVVLFWRVRTRHKTSAVTRLEISEKEITMRDSDATATVPWSAFRQCLESEKLFVLLDRPKTMLLVLPKRAFPDQSWQSWFRDQAGREIGATGVGTVTNLARPAVASENSTTIRFQLRFRDFLEHTLHSRRTWAMIVGIEGLLLGTFIYTAVHPHQNAIYSPKQIFLAAVVPFLLVVAGMGVFIPCTFAWLIQRRDLKPQTVTLSEDGIKWVSCDEDTDLKWTALKRFKETPWSFFISARNGGSTLMLPKTAFASTEDVRRAAALLDEHLERSRCFI